MQQEHEVDADGIAVHFPRKPYAVQELFMHSTVQALKSDSVALLESPTGTGKTLCLLAATLAWQEWEFKQRKQHGGDNTHIGAQLGYGDGANSSKTGDQQRAAINSSFGWAVQAEQASQGAAGPGGKGNNKVRAKPRTIIYASRTHSQLQQVVRELKKTRYRPDMVVLGSREQMCINDKLLRKHKGGSALIHACQRACSTHSCKPRNNLEQVDGTWLSSLSIEDRVADIEDLVRRGRKEQVCPYFAARDAVPGAKLILVPYNYLLDASIRKLMDVQWEGAVVIFDEAHNIESSACDAVSVSLSSAELGLCIEDLKKVLERLHLAESGGDTVEQAPAAGANKPKVEKRCVIDLLNLVFEMEQRLDRVPLLPSGPGPTDSTVMPGEWLGKMFVEARRTKQLVKGFLEDKTMVMEQLKACIEYHMGGGGESMDLSFDGATTTATAGAAPIVVSKLETLLRVFDVAYPHMNTKTPYQDDYKIFLCERQDKDLPGHGRGQHGQAYSSQRGAQSGKKPWMLHYWGFSPGIAMMNLKAQGVGAIVLASGTLSPMGHLQADLKLPGPYKELQNSHVIDLKRQVWVGATGVGPKGQRLSSTYEVRETRAYKDELGDAICMILQAMSKVGGGGDVLSREVEGLDGGVLIFFPSYRAMEDLQARWKSSGLWAALEHLGGSIIVEPKGGGSNKGKAEAAPRGGGSRQYPSKPAVSTHKPKHSDFLDAATVSASTGGDDEDDESDGLKGFIQQFESAISTQGKCVLLAVCRGKVSEGIDFTDNKGRVVIMTGIPYAPPSDPWVTLKRQYMDEHSAGAGAGAGAGAKQTGGGGWAGAAGAVQSKTTFDRGPPAGWGAPVAAARPPLGPKMRTLSGEQWYKQSACRAVNQALGRIIRHAGDWGGIFLLDERFQYSAQKEQLSQWMKPRHAAFPKFSAAVESFAMFASAAKRDPALNVAALAAAHSPTKIRNRPDPAYLRELRERVDVQVGKRVKVVMSASQLPSDTGESFIDPKLLAAQAVDTSSAARPLWSKKSVVSTGAAPFRLTTSELAEQDADFERRAQLAGKVKSSKLIPEKKASLFGAPAAKAAATADSKVLAKAKVVVKDDLAHIKAGLADDRRSNVSAGMFSASSSSSSSSSGGGSRSSFGGKLTIGGFSGAIKQVPRSQQATQPPLSQSQSTQPSLGFSRAPAAAAAAESATPAPRKAAPVLDKEAQKEAMKKAVSEVQRHLDKPVFTELLQIVSKARKAKLPALQDVEQFINRVLTLLRNQSEIHTGHMLKLLRGLQYLVDDEQLRAKYVQGAEVKCSMAGKDSAKKRDLEDWKDIENMVMPDENGGAGKGKRSKYLCPICKEQALAPCAAKCGHVCCKECWSQWLRVKPACPICKGATDADSIMRIVFK